MIKKDNIKDIMKSIRQDFNDATERDIAFVVLCDNIEDKGLCYNLAYGINTRNPNEYFEKVAKIQKARDILETYGIGGKKESVTKDENKSELLRLLRDIKRQRAEGTIEAKDALKMEADIRVKLNDKFDMEEGKGQKRIIIVPQKHDIICPHTNRECTNMPTKEACMKHYGLKDTNTD